MGFPKVETIYSLYERGKILNCLGKHASVADVYSVAEDTFDSVVSLLRKETKSNAHPLSRGHDDPFLTSKSAHDRFLIMSKVEQLWLLSGHHEFRIGQDAFNLLNHTVADLPLRSLLPGRQVSALRMVFDRSLGEGGYPNHVYVVFGADNQDLQTDEARFTLCAYTSGNPLLDAPWIVDFRGPVTKNFQEFLDLGHEAMISREGDAGDSFGIRSKAIFNMAVLLYGLWKGKHRWVVPAKTVLQTKRSRFEPVRFDLRPDRTLRSSAIDPGRMTLDCDAAEIQFLFDWPRDRQVDSSVEDANNPVDVGPGG